MNDENELLTTYLGTAVGITVGVSVVAIILRIRWFNMSLTYTLPKDERMVITDKSLN